jgi:hypothetical protein
MKTIEQVKEDAESLEREQKREESSVSKSVEPSSAPTEGGKAPSTRSDELNAGISVESASEPVAKPLTPDTPRIPSPLPPPEVKPPVSARSASPAGEPPKEPRAIPVRRGSIPTGSSGNAKSAFLPSSHVSSGRTSPATEASNEDVARTLAERNMKSADVTHVASEFGAHSYAVEEAVTPRVVYLVDFACRRSHTVSCVASPACIFRAFEHNTGT